MIVAIFVGFLLATAVLAWCSPARLIPGTATTTSRAPSSLRLTQTRIQGKNVRGGQRAPSGPGLPAATLVELTAVQLDAGLPLAEAVANLGATNAGLTTPELARVGAALRLGLNWDAAWPEQEKLSPQLRAFRDALEFTATSGAASTAVLRSQADLVRRAEYRKAERAAESLAVHLVLPLGLCSLPAFMCWGVLPVLMSLLPAVFGS